MKEKSSANSYRSYEYTSKVDRTIHKVKDASYMLPNDQNETDRLLLQQNLISNFLNGNFLSPIEPDLKKGITVLDSGCGPGVWITDMAETYPDSTFHGIDISDVVPEHWKLENTIYTLGNITKDIPYSDSYFDYIHQQLLIFGLSRSDWKSAMRNFYKVLKPGGYIEFFEVKLHGQKNVKPLFKELTETYEKMMVGRDMVPNIINELETMMKEAGFENITVVYKDCPLTFETEEGRLQWENLSGVYKGLAPFLVKYSDNWKDLSDFDEHLVKILKEPLEQKHNYRYAIVYGQKPLK